MTPPRVFAVAGWRYEPAWLVDELKANLAWVDQLVIVDDRQRHDELWIHEGHYRRLQRQAVIDAGIRPWDWVLVTSPDERWEVTAERVIRRLAATRTRTIYEVPLREMWTPTHYRTDGFWGAKWRPRLFPFLPGQTFTGRRIQTQPVPVDRSYRRVKTSRTAIYHLEQIDPLSRVERAIVYEALSPGSRQRAAASRHWRRADRTGRYMRRYGFAYLADPRGKVLTPIPPGRGFDPPVEQVYEFRVPDHLLYQASGRTRDQWRRWLTSTLGLTWDEVVAG